MKNSYLALWMMCLCSCAGYSSISNGNLTRIDKDNLHSLNGDYSSELWNYLAPLSHKVKDTIHYTVSLEVINSKRLKAILKKENLVIDTRKVKGRIKKDFFSVRRKVYPIGFPAIFFKYYENKLEISLTNKDELYLDVSESRFGWALLLLTGGSGDNFHKTYKKK